MIPVDKLGVVASALNIEGGHPYFELLKSSHTKNPIWANLVLVLDAPLIDGITFDEIMENNRYPLLESAVVDISEQKMFAQYLSVIKYYLENGRSLTNINSEDTLHITVHVHQSIKSQYLVEILKSMVNNTMGKLLTDSVLLGYRTDYISYADNSTCKDYDGTNILISLSQAAGLSVNGDTMIIPSTFIPYDIDNKKIDITQKYYVKNDLANGKFDDIINGYYYEFYEYICKNYTSPNPAKARHNNVVYRDVCGYYCPMLQVSKLWNPSDETELVSVFENVLDAEEETELMKEYRHGIKERPREDNLHYDFRTILSFVQNNTQHFDDSHNWIHAVKVYLNAKKIMKHTMPKYNELFLMVVAMFHDVRDHKYPESISRDRLESEIDDYLNDGSNDGLVIMALKIIDNISYSKEVKGLRENIDKEYQIYLDVVADADRLEALGKIGIERCEQFTRQINGKVPGDVVKHCHEKLLKLLPDGFIKTEYAKELAKPLHQEIVDYVAKYEHNKN